MLFWCLRHSRIQVSQYIYKYEPCTLNPNCPLYLEMVLLTAGTSARRTMFSRP